MVRRAAARAGTKFAARLAAKLAARSRLLLLLLPILVTISLTAESPAADTRYRRMLERYAEVSEVVSGGFLAGSPLRIAVGTHVAFEAIPQLPATAGLYVLAIDGQRVVLEEHYNTYLAAGASEGMARDIEKLALGTFVIVAAKDEPTRYLDARGQSALRSLGAQQGFAGAPHRTSYMLLGIKGMSPGAAIEHVGAGRLEHRGPKAGTPFRLRPKRAADPPSLDRATGAHDGLMIGGTEVLYYVPRSLRLPSAQYLVAIHGAGAWHRPGAVQLIEGFRDLAERENLVVIAPVFDCIYNQKVDLDRDLDGRLQFRDPKIIRDWHLWDFVGLVNSRHRDRADHRLVEIFTFFRKHLFDRPRFHLFGHSGGGQFAARFATVHPDLVLRVAACSAGSYAFPRRDYSFPLGLGTTRTRLEHGHNDLEDLLLRPAELDERMSRFLDVQMFVVVGADDLVGADVSELAWQGSRPPERASNYVAALEREAQRLIERGVRDTPARVELHLLEGVGHDAATSIRVGSELMFPGK